MSAAIPIINPATGLPIVINATPPPPAPPGQYDALSNVELIQHALSFKVPNAPDEKFGDFLIIGLDLESFLHPPRTVMEFSVPVLDSRDVVGLQPGPHGLNILSKIKFNHFRVREMGQWRNIAPFAQGYDKHAMFEFGKSEWIARAEGKEVLTQIFRVEDGDSIRKVILLGHAARDDTIHLAYDFNFRVGELGCLERIIDLQDVARTDLNWYHPPKLSAVMRTLGLTSDNLHNSGNDAAFQMICVIKIAVDVYIHSADGVSKKNLNGFKEFLPSPQAVVNMVKHAAVTAAANNPPMLGTFFYCLRCGGHDHDNANRQCTLHHIQCKRCQSRRHDVIVCNVPERFLSERIARNMWVNGEKDAQAAYERQQQEFQRQQLVYQHRHRFQQRKYVKITYYHSRCLNIANVLPAVSMPTVTTPKVTTRTCEELTGSQCGENLRTDDEVGDQKVSELLTIQILSEVGSDFEHSRLLHPGSEELCAYFTLMGW